jgi:alpha-ketoglutarate-dependent taurine dioxygenase
MATLKFKKLKPFGTLLEDASLNDVEVVRSLSIESPLLVLRDVQINGDEDLLNFAQRISRKTGNIQDKLLHWDFGPVMNMGFKSDAANYLFSSENVPFHWDGAFYREPQWLLFYCVKSCGVGGETLFSNTEKIWTEASKEERRLFAEIELSYETEKKAHYGGKVKVKMLQHHPISGREILRYAEEVETKLNPVTLEITTKGDLDTEKFVSLMQERIYNSDHCYRHIWKVGDLILADNFSLIHGRKALGKNLERSFKRIQIL